MITTELNSVSGMCGKQNKGTYADGDGMVVLEVVSYMMVVQRFHRLTSMRGWYVDKHHTEEGQVREQEDAYKRFDVKHISMHILWSWTTFFASSFRNVACPSLAGVQERSFKVSSGGFFAV